MRLSPVLAIALAVTACATSTGILAVGLDTYTVSEMRAPALGGGPEAQRAVLAEANAFCASQGRVFAPVFMRPDGDPYTPYYPTAYDATFRCVPPAGHTQ
jgi:hypothetical protein